MNIDPTTGAPIADPAPAFTGAPVFPTGAVAAPPAAPAVTEPAEQLRNFTDADLAAFASILEAKRSAVPAAPTGRAEPVFQTEATAYKAGQIVTRHVSDHWHGERDDVGLVVGVSDETVPHALVAWLPAAQRARDADLKAP